MENQNNTNDTRSISDSQPKSEGEKKTTQNLEAKDSYFDHNSPYFFP